jgi:hypothetical protein
MLPTEMEFAPRTTAPLKSQDTLAEEIVSPLRRNCILESAPVVNAPLMLKIKSPPVESSRVRIPVMPRAAAAV